MKSLLIAFLTALFLGALAGCAKSAAKPDDVAYYTCTMHPSVRSQDPDGKCPICGMDLVPVAKVAATNEPAESTAADMPRVFTVPLDRQQLIGVTFAPALVKPLNRIIRSVGIVSATTTKHWDYVARVDGYVHDLKVAAPGDPVRKGQVLMDIYSPDLVATEHDYLDLLRMRDEGRRFEATAATVAAEHLLSGARARLEQWNISAAQIDILEKSGQVSQYLPLNSPFDGVVEEVGVHQGRHVSIGDHLVDVVDLSSVWVWADFYENELPLLRPGLAVTITGASLQRGSLSGKIALIDPFLDKQKRTGRVRIDVDNPGLNLLPEAYVNVELALDEGEGLTVPLDAVLPTGEHNIVFVDKGGGKLEPRYIDVGGKFGELYWVTSGLKAGERVVSSANFLIDAESKVQGALKSW